MAARQVQKRLLSIFATRQPLPSFRNGLNGAILQIISHGFIGAALFFLAGTSYDRIRLLYLNEMGGAAIPMPKLFTMFSSFSLASLALPETSSHLLPSATSFFRAGESYARGIQILVEPTKQGVGNVEKQEACSLKASSNSGDSVSGTISDNNSGVTFNAKSSLKVSPRHDTCMIFTCKVCDTRSVKTVSRESYEKGVVVARCGGCNNLHLIADHLGMFGEPGSIEEILAARGEEVRKGTMDTLNLTLEDLAGTKA